MKMIRPLFLSLISLTFLFLAGCEREWDKPPIKEIPEGNVFTIEELRSMYQGDPIHFEGDSSVYATVSMDDQSGNIYKSSYVQDSTGAINLATLYAGGLYQGDRVRINLKGTILRSSNQLLQLDSVDVDENIVKQETNVAVEPKVVTLDQLDSSLQSHLIKLENVEFKGSELGKTYANADDQIDKNRTLIDCNGNDIIVRTSGYAEFADDSIPYGNGNLIAILGQYRSDMQLYIRRTSEVNLTGQRCTGEVIESKDFSDNSLTSGGWSTYDVSGSKSWSIGNFSGSNAYAELNGTGGSNNDWLISPAINLSDHIEASVSFQNAKNYTGPDLELMVSTDYVGGSDPQNSGATWTSLSYNKSSGSFNWVGSGKVDLTSYTGNSSVYVAFKYTSGSNAAHWEVDDIAIEALK